MLATVGLKIIGSTPCLSPFIAQRPTEILQWKKEPAACVGARTARCAAGAVRRGQTRRGGPTRLDLLRGWRGAPHGRSDGCPKLTAHRSQMGPGMEPEVLQQMSARARGVRRRAAVRPRFCVWASLLHRPSSFPCCCCACRGVPFGRIGPGFRAQFWQPLRWRMRSFSARTFPRGG